MKTNEIIFSPGLSFDQKLKSMENLINYLMKSETNKISLSILNGTNLLIGYQYRLNNDGSIQIPWNWYETE